MVDEMIQNQPDWRKKPHPYATAKTAGHVMFQIHIDQLLSKNHVNEVEFSGTALLLQFWEKFIQILTIKLSSMTRQEN